MGGTLAESQSADLVALDDAMKTLATLNARQSRVVELRFFGGLSLEEIAHVVDVSVGTVRPDWSLARAWVAAPETEPVSASGPVSADD